MKNRNKRLLLLGSICVLLVMMMTFVLSACVDPNKPTPPEEIKRIETVELDDLSEGADAGVFAVKKLEDADFHTELQSSYLKDELNSISKYASGNAELSYPDAIELEWYFQPADEELKLTGYVVSLGEKEDLSDAKTYTARQAKLSLYNLKIGTIYYYSITAKYGEEEFVSQIVSFNTTEQGPRNLRIEGISNSRDLGGRKTTDGGMVKQGLVFRTARLNASNTTTVSEQITAAGKQVMLNDLGVKTELDLRGGSTTEAGGITSSVLGDSVQYVYLPMRWDGIKNLLMGNNECFVTAFHILGDEANYPVFYHCNIGTDRTGVLTMLIDGLLGVPEEELYRDYLFSNFGNIGGSRSLGDASSVNSVIGYMNFLKSFEGENLAEKIYNFLLTIGVPSTDLDSVISIMKEGGKDNTGKAVNIGMNGLLPAGVTQTTPSEKFAPDAYYNLSGAGKSVTANITASAATKADIYMYIASANTSTRINASLALKLDGNTVTLPTDTFNEAGCRDAEKTWVPVLLATVDLTAGAHSLELSSIAANGANISSITVIPHDGKVTSDVNAKTLGNELSVAQTEFIGKNVTAKGNSFDVYVYATQEYDYTITLNATATAASAKVAENIVVSVNGEDVELDASKTYAQYNGKIELVAKIAAGLNKITVSCVGDNGCTVKSVDFKIKLPAWMTCDHKFVKGQATAIDGETANAWYVCEKCGYGYNVIEAEACANHIQTASNIKDTTVKLGNGGDWLEFVLYSPVDIKADIILFATVSASSSVYAPSTSLRVIVNDATYNSTATKAYKDYGLTETDFAELPVATVELEAGYNTIRVNRYGDYGCTVDYIKVAPLGVVDRSDIKVDPSLTCTHNYKVETTELADGETKLTWYVCENCGHSYYVVRAVDSRYSIQTSSNITSTTIKLGNNGDWIEFKVWSSAATRANIYVNATVSTSSSTQIPALNASVNGVTYESTATGTYASYGLTTTNFADIPLATVSLQAGLNTIRVNRVGNYGCTVAHIRVVPKATMDRSELNPQTPVDDDPTKVFEATGVSFANTDNKVYLILSGTYGTGYNADTLKEALYCDLQSDDSRAVLTVAEFTAANGNFTAKYEVSSVAADGLYRVNFGKGRTDKLKLDVTFDWNRYTVGSTAYIPVNEYNAAEDDASGNYGVVGVRIATIVDSVTSGYTADRPQPEWLHSQDGKILLTVTGKTPLYFIPDDITLEFVTDQPGSGNSSDNTKNSTQPLVEGGKKVGVEMRTDGTFALTYDITDWAVNETTIFPRAVFAQSNGTYYKYNYPTASPNADATFTKLYADGKDFALISAAKASSTRRYLLTVKAHEHAYDDEGKCPICGDQMEGVFAATDVSFASADDKFIMTIVGTYSDFTAESLKKAVVCGLANGDNMTALTATEFTAENGNFTAKYDVTSVEAGKLYTVIFGASQNAALKLDKAFGWTRSVIGTTAYIPVNEFGAEDAAGNNGAVGLRIAAVADSVTSGYTSDRPQPEWLYNQDGKIMFTVSGKTPLYFVPDDITLEFVTDQPGSGKESAQPLVEGGKKVGVTMRADGTFTLTYDITDWAVNETTIFPRLVFAQSNGTYYKYNFTVVSPGANATFTKLYAENKDFALISATKASATQWRYLLTVKAHEHDYDDEGKCTICGDQMEGVFAATDVSFASADDKFVMTIAGTYKGFTADSLKEAVVCGLANGDSMTALTATEFTAANGSFTAKYDVTSVEAGKLYTVIFGASQSAALTLNKSFDWTRYIIGTTAYIPVNAYGSEAASDNNGAVSLRIAAVGTAASGNVSASEPTAGCLEVKDGKALLTINGKCTDLYYIPDDLAMEFTTDRPSSGKKSDNAIAGAVKYSATMHADGSFTIVYDITGLELADTDLFPRMLFKKATADDNGEYYQFNFGTGTNNTSTVTVGTKDYKVYKSSANSNRYSVKVSAHTHTYGEDFVCTACGEKAPGTFAATNATFAPNDENSQMFITISGTYTGFEDTEVMKGLLYCDMQRVGGTGRNAVTMAEFTASEGAFSVKYGINTGLNANERYFFHFGVSTDTLLKLDVDYNWARYIIGTRAYIPVNVYGSDAAEDCFGAVAIRVASTSSPTSVSAAVPTADSIEVKDGKVLLTITNGSTINLYYIPSDLGMEFTTDQPSSGNAGTTVEGAKLVSVTMRTNGAFTIVYDITDIAVQGGSLFPRVLFKKPDGTVHQFNFGTGSSPNRALKSVTVGDKVYSVEVEMNSSGKYRYVLTIKAATEE